MIPSHVLRSQFACNPPRDDHHPKGHTNPMTGPLKNPRHERFAQELAKGKSQGEAYADAGYSPSRSSAARLASDANICARVAVLQERVAKRTEVTVAGITERLLRIARRRVSEEGQEGVRAFLARRKPAWSI